MVVIGTSFIGMEVASYLADKASSVECIDIAAMPFLESVGRENWQDATKGEGRPQEGEGERERS